MAQKHQEQARAGRWTPLWTRKSYQPAVYYSDAKYPDSWIMEDQEGRAWLVGLGADAWDTRTPYDGGYSYLTLADAPIAKAAIMIAGGEFDANKGLYHDWVREIAIYKRLPMPQGGLRSRP